MASCESQPGCNKGACRPIPYAGNPVSELADIRKGPGAIIALVQTPRLAATVTASSSQSGGCSHVQGCDSSSTPCYTRRNFWKGIGEEAARESMRNCAFGRVARRNCGVLGRGVCHIRRYAVEP